ncbi:MAG TPA: hypothetical protein DDZ11_13000 [Lentisphaeria bacterium]|nr:hypothetical protein [Lentisphaeria bacterium]
MSNFLLWLIAQNTAQSLAHQMQKDNPVGWLRTQLFFWTGTIVVTLVLLYFALPEAFWTIVLTPVVIAIIAFAVRLILRLSKPDEPKENEVVLEGIPAIWNFIIFLIGITGAIAFIVWYINYRNG